MPFAGATPFASAVNNTHRKFWLEREIARTMLHGEPCCHRFRGVEWNMWGRMPTGTSWWV